jgi:hypothetical protein
MKNLRYTELLVPIDRYISRLTPKAKLLLGMLEGGLFLVLFTSVLLYTHCGKRLNGAGERGTVRQFGSSAC